jgi:hypothetical protein
MAKITFSSFVALVATLLAGIAYADIPSGGGGGCSLSSSHPAGAIALAMVAVGVALLSIGRRKG